MGHYDLARRNELTGILYNACPMADLGSDFAGFSASDFMLLLQMALDLIWPYCILALLAYGYPVLCQMVEMLTCYAYN
jgi:hypothetical protein